MFFEGGSSLNHVFVVIHKIWKKKLTIFWKFQEPQKNETLKSSMKTKELSRENTAS